VLQSVGPFQHMPHRELLTESQRLSLQAPASDERGIVRHYTLSSEDLALINRRRGDPNRLGFALMLCYLRFPGRIPMIGQAAAGKTGVERLELCRRAYVNFALRWPGHFTAMFASTFSNAL
jgi:Domain of unknown function (DUF4158)